jgi:hypothetical protein
MNEIATVTPSTDLATSQSENGTTSLLNFVALAVKDKDIDVSKLDALLRMQREIVADEAKLKFNQALARMTTGKLRVKKNGRVDLGQGKGSYDFATWPDMDDVLRPLMEREGFTLSFNMETKDGGGAVVSGTLLHIDGHSRTVTVPLALDAGAGRNNLQAMGSTLSYGKRYCAEMLFNIVREGADDDGKLGGTEFITAAQAAEIEALLADGGPPRDPFLEWIGAVRVENIQAADYAKVVNSLLSRKKRTQGGSATR